MRKDKKSALVSTFLGPEASIEGTLEFEGTIRLDGRVKGSICSSDGTVIVGEKAVVQGDIIVTNVIVTGEVNGNINAAEKIQVCALGRVIGDIHAPVISIDSGATFNGNCGMKEQKPAEPKAEAGSKAGLNDKKPLTNS